MSVVKYDFKVLIKLIKSNLHIQLTDKQVDFTGCSIYYWLDRYMHILV